MGRTLRSSMKRKSQSPSVSRSSEQNGVVQPTKPSKQKSEAEVGSSPAVSENVVVVSENVVADSSLSDAPDTSGLPKESEEKTAEVAELEFEAKSSRDEAWYDVAMFLAHRVLNSGELEVRVRFQGFGAEEDEWVNVKSAVRERSIPLEASDCRKVRVGDLALCFQENNDQAMYFDAHIVEIERKLHDIRGCRCLFSVRYDHDQTEEKVHAQRLCRRPAY